MNISVEHHRGNSTNSDRRQRINTCPPKGRNLCRRILYVLFLAAPAFATDPASYTGTVLQEYQWPAAPALQMPTSVAVSPDGMVAVADGVNDRILQFAPDGQLSDQIRSVGEARLHDPISVSFDKEGRLWIADTGNRRIVVRGQDGALARTIEVSQESGGHKFDPTAVVPIDDGQRAWIIDNDGQRVIQWDAESSPAEWIRLGTQGPALGQFYYPFMAAAGPDARLFVSDTLNGRVQVVSSSGKPLAVVGTYGVEPGQLYRPKGVAVGDDGNVWVADSVTGVVQVFEPAGRFLAVLDDPAGQPLKFATPVGIAFGPQGHLYVAELSADRIRRVEIRKHPRPKEVPRPGRARVLPGDGRSPACTICHLEWIPELADGGQSPLVSLPEHGPDHPVVSQEETCLSCHDGSVVDSRRRVWQEHGHRTGATPPEGMKVPDFLPLVDHKIACRTCHSAHAGGQQNQSLQSAVFVRAENGSGSLCMTCHEDKALGPRAGAHPVGGMPWAIPEKLIQEGAKTGVNPRELTCYVCHMPHGSQEDHLLVMGTESSQLCLTCHAKLRPGLWRPEAEREHPQNPPLQSEAQKQAIQEMGTQVGAGDTLICLSCHRVHHGVSDRYLLADTLEDSRLCIRCHPERAQMQSSRHDLRTSAPDCRNRIGQTADQSGPCGACHTFHRYARMPDPQPQDPTGLCTSCHQPESCAGKVDFKAPGHPNRVQPGQLPAGIAVQTFPAPDGEAQTIACLTCHNPHQTADRSFLAMPQEKLCGQCHPGPAASLAGSHEMSGLDVRNSEGRTPAEAGKCGFCHTMHEAKGPVLWAATETPPATPDDLCTSCHREGGLAAEMSESELHHPTGPQTAEAAARLTTDLPLFDQRAGKAANGFVSCGSCHDPHGNPQVRPKLLRAGPKTSDLCVNCHQEPARLAGGLHDMRSHPLKWPESSQNADDLCESCHRAHGSDPQKGLWSVVPASQYAASDGVCLSCHGHLEWSGHGTRPAAPGAATQPAVPAPEPSLHGLPLVPTSPGRRSGAVGCKTCHNPHGPPGAQPHLLRAEAAQDPGAMCLACHRELQYIGLSLHSREMMKNLTVQREQPMGRMLQCGPCHSVHAADQAAEPLPAPFADLPQDVQRCVACHRPNGGATPVELVDHFGPIQNVAEPSARGFMPLVNDAGTIGSSGRVACITCHSPHGRPPGPAFPQVDPGTITVQQLQAMMPMVRPYTPPNLCSSCHGFDGLMRYLYWHNPSKRRAVPE